MQQTSGQVTSGQETSGQEAITTFWTTRQLIDLVGRPLHTSHVTLIGHEGSLRCANLLVSSLISQVAVGIQNYWAFKPQHKAGLNGMDHRTCTFTEGTDTCTRQVSMMYTCTRQDSMMYTCTRQDSMMYTCTRQDSMMYTCTRQDSMMYTCTRQDSMMYTCTRQDSMMYTCTRQDSMGWTTAPAPSPKAPTPVPDRSQ